MLRPSWRIGFSILICFLIQAKAADKYTDENRPYEFGFVVDVEGKRQQHRHEEKDKDGIIKGEFGFITADDVYHVTVYATDKDGHFRILSMKNIHLKSSTVSTTGSPRQGHSLSLSSPLGVITKPQGKTALIPQSVQPPSAVLAPPAAPNRSSNAIALPKAISQPSPVRSCSSCSIPTTTTRVPPVELPVNNPLQNYHSSPVSAPVSSNSLQLNNGNLLHSSQPGQPKNPELGSALFTNDNTGNAFYKSQQPSKTTYTGREPSVAADKGFKFQQLEQSSYTGQGPSVPSGVGLNFQTEQELSIPATTGLNSPQLEQSSYTGQGLSVQAKAGLNSQQSSVSFYTGQEPNPQLSRQTNPKEPSLPSSVSLNPQSLSQSLYTGQVPNVQEINQNFQHEVSNVGGAELVSQQPEHPSQSSYTKQGSSFPSNIQAISISGESRNSPDSFSNAHNNFAQLGISSSFDKMNTAGLDVASDGQQYPNIPSSGQSNYRQSETGERTSKQYKGPEQRYNQSNTPKQILVTNAQPGKELAKPKLVSVNMQIVDKNTNIYELQPGEREGLPPSLNENYMTRLLYTFNYTVGFHGHYEEGFANGIKKGYYYVTGRNGVRTRIDYVADKTGFHPKMSQEVLDLLSDDVPKPETEKDTKYGLKGYEFKWLYFPVDE